MVFLTEKEEKIVKKFAQKLKYSLDDKMILLKLFGSKVRGDSSPDSDIDILLVVKEKTPELRDLVFNILFDLDPYYEFKISPIIYSDFEYKRNEELESTFVETVKKEGVAL